MMILFLSSCFVPREMFHCVHPLPPLYPFGKGVPADSLSRSRRFITLPFTCWTVTRVRFLVFFLFRQVVSLPQGLSAFFSRCMSPSSPTLAILLLPWNIPPPPMISYCPFHIRRLNPFEHKSGDPSSLRLTSMNFLVSSYCLVTEDFFD